MPDTNTNCNKTFEVINTLILNQDEKNRVTLSETLFFYHSWLRNEKEIISIIHEILMFHCQQGKNSNYHKVSIFPECNNLLYNDSGNDPEYLNELIDELSDMITSAYGLENYTCCYHEGDWGLFHSDLFE